VDTAGRTVWRRLSAVIKNIGGTLMGKRLAKSQNTRPDHSVPFISVPHNGLDTFIIVTDRDTAERFIAKLFSENENLARAHYRNM
jgi:hypothetical protein